VSDGLTYEAAGVSLDAAEASVERLKEHVARTSRAEVLGGIGGFGGLFELDLKRWKRPVLVSGTDGVGTKVELARSLGRHDTVGVDLVAMVVDDIVVTGAEPLFFLDYVAVGKLDPEHLAQIVAGIADGCVQAGCALVGGETAEHPGVMPAGHYDLAGFGVGVVERDAMLGPERVCAGDEIVAMASSGPHSNGYSLIRRIVEGVELAEEHGLGMPLGEALLRPTRIYAKDCLALAASGNAHALCHVTGGGIPGNLPRVLPAHLGATVDVRTFEVPAVFRWLQARGGVAEDESWRVWNMGAGMLAVVPDGRGAVDLLTRRGVDAWVCGRVTEEPGVRLTH
jgi:phosphoribosylformylglycinamidine cyclo-ligase